MIAPRRACPGPRAASPYRLPIGLRLLQCPQRISWPATRGQPGLPSRRDPRCRQPARWQPPRPYSPQCFAGIDRHLCKGTRRIITRLGPMSRLSATSSAKNLSHGAGCRRRWCRRFPPAASSCSTSSRRLGLPDRAVAATGILGGVQKSGFWVALMGAKVGAEPTCTVIRRGWATSSQHRPR